MKIATLGISLLLGSLGALSYCQPQPKVVYQVIVPKGIKPGKEFTIQIKVKLPEGWHAYGPNPNATKGEQNFNTVLGVTMEQNKSFDRFMPQPVTPPARKSESNPKDFIYEHQVTIPVILRIKAGTKSAKIKLLVNHQLCDSSTCVPPHTDTIEVKFDFTKASK